MTTERADLEAHYAYAACEAIRSGAWDRYLPSVRIALNLRMTEAEFKAWVLSAAELRVR